PGVLEDGYRTAFVRPGRGQDAAEVADAEHASEALDQRFEDLLGTQGDTDVLERLEPPGGGLGVLHHRDSLEPGANPQGKPGAEFGEVDRRRQGIGGTK